MISIQIYLAYLNTFTFSCIQMILYTTIPYIAEKADIATANIIGAIGVGSFIFSFMGPFWAARSDHLGRKRILSFGMFGMVISFTLLSSLFILNVELSSFFKILIIFLSRIIYGLLCSSIVPVSQAWQLDLSPNSDHLKVLTRNSMCLNLGRIVGPMLVLIKQVHFEYVIYLATLWVSGLSLFVYFTSSSYQYFDQKRLVSFKEVLFKWRKSIEESFLPILLAMIFTCFIGVLHSFLGHHVKTVLNISGQEATLIFAKIILVLSLSVIAIQQLSLILFKSNWKIRVVLGSLAIVAGTFVMMEAKDELGIWFSIILVSIATAFIPPAYLTLLSKSEENTEKSNIFGKKLGLASVAHSLGYALGAGFIAISMKLKFISESFVVFLISFGIMFVSFLLLTKSFKGASYVKNIS